MRSLEQPQVDHFSAVGAFAEKKDDDECHHKAHKRQHRRIHWQHRAISVRDNTHDAEHDAQREQELN